MIERNIMEPPEHSDSVMEIIYQLDKTIQDGDYEEALNLAMEGNLAHPGNLAIETLFLAWLKDFCDWGSQYRHIMSKFVFRNMECASSGGIVTISPHTALFYAMSNKQLQAIARSYFKSVYKNADPITFMPQKPTKKVKSSKPKGEIRVALLSADLRDHAFAYNIVEWIEYHSSIEKTTNVKLYCIATKNDDPKNKTLDKSFRERIKKYSHFYDQSKISKPRHPKDDESAIENLSNFIKQLEIDILLDCNGFTAGCQHKLLLKKPAPIIATFAVGTPGTITNIVHDYIILDSVVAPFPQCAEDCLEKVVHISPTYFFGSQVRLFQNLTRMETFYTSEMKKVLIHGNSDIPVSIASQIDQIYNSDESVYMHGNYKIWNGRTVDFAAVYMHSHENDLIATTRREFNLPETGLIYGSFNSFKKFNPETIQLYVEILKAVENSVILFIAYTDVGFQHIREYVDSITDDAMSARFISTPFSNCREQLMRKCAIVDLMLDNFPCGGHTTTLDALASRTPVLTKMGTTQCSRLPAALLYAVDMPELVTNSCSEFVEKGIYFGRNPGKLEQLSKKLEEQRQISAAWDAERFTFEMIRAFQQMYRAGVIEKNVTHIPAPSEFSSDDVKIYDIGIDHEIGRGNNGIVYEGTFRGQKVAVKKITPKTQGWEYVNSELEIHRQLGHRGIVKLIAACAKDDAMLILELCCMNVSMVLSQSRLSLVNASRFTIQLVAALDHLHERDIIHRDIKASNCLIDNLGNLKLADFGHAVKTMIGGRFDSYVNSFLSTNASKEVNDDRKYSFASDVYACGMTISAFFVGNDVGRLSVGRKIKNLIGDKATLPVVVLHMLNDEPLLRPTTKALMSVEQFYQSANIRLNSMFDENPNKAELFSIRLEPLQNTDEENDQIDMNLKELAEHRLIMKFYQYDMLKDTAIRRRKQIEIGSIVILNAGLWKGEIGKILNLEKKFALVRFNTSSRIVQEDIEKRVPIWMLQKY